MKGKMITLGFCAFVVTSAMSQTSKPLPQLGKNSIKEVIGAMTLEEKTKLVVGTGMRISDFTPSGDAKPAEKPVEKPAAKPDEKPVLPLDIMEAMSFGDSKVPGAAGILYEVPRLGIPAIVVADGPAGLRINPIRKNAPDKTFYCTAFPVATLLASSWDKALAESIGVAMGNEAKEYGVDVLLSPALNIHRNPLGGRNFEYFSEDPLIAGKMTAALVRGVQSQGIGTSIKHFAVNSQETNRMEMNAILSERALREIYLKGFEIAVKEAQPFTVMSSYNKINGVYASESPELLNTILRNEWGFKGFVMTDWFGGKDAVAQMKAGNDLLMPGRPSQAKAIEQAVKNGTLSMAVLDKNVERILNIILKSQTFKKYNYTNAPDLKGHAAIARAAAAEGMILLKNNSNVLPLKAKNLALFGNSAYELFSGGTGSGDVNEAYTVSLVEGLSNVGYNVDKTLQSNYEAHIKTAKAARPPKKAFFDLEALLAENPLSREAIEAQAAANDAALITIGRNAGEFQDRKLEGDFYLTEVEKTLIKNVSKAFRAKNKAVIIILNIGGVIETASWRDDADAILLAWQGGQEAGNAIADVLNGKVNPSGKLATTFPITFEDVPSSKNFPVNAAEKPTESRYEEGIYVGYRYFDAFKVKPAYEFGFGMSYTNFEYSNLTLNSKQFTDKITVTVSVTNKGNVAGREAVQLYISAPSKTMVKPEKELKAFDKTVLLEPNQTQKISFTIDANMLTSFDAKQSVWLADAGKYSVKIGASSRDIRQSADFQLGKNIILRKEHKVLAPQSPISEMKP